MKLSQFVTAVKTNDGVLLFNSLNTAFVHLGADEYNEIQQFLSYPEFNLSNQPSELINELASMEIIVDSALDEFSDLERRYWDFRNSSEYIKVVIAPTSYCNFACIYCFEQGNHASTMSNETAQVIVQKIKDKLCSEESIGLALIWYGGEPLIAWEIVKSITTDLWEFCREFGIQFKSSIVTNGYLLSANRIYELKQSGITSVQITLDGDCSSHDARRPLKNGKGTFREVYNNITLCSAELMTCVRLNIDKKNIESVRHLIDKLQQDELNNIVLSFARVEPFNNYSRENCFLPEEFARIEVDLLAYAEKAGFKGSVALPTPSFGFCEAVSKHNLLFDSDGDNFFCWENVGRKELTNCSLCNSEKYERLKNYFVNTYSFFEKKCTSCSILPICLGGCPQRRLENGSAQCPSLFYNLKEQLEMYYYFNFVPTDKKGE